MLFAHGGSVGFLLEISVIVVPLLLLGLFAWWGRRHGVLDEEEPGPGDGSSRAPQKGER